MKTGIMLIMLLSLASLGLAQEGGAPPTTAGSPAARPAPPPPKNLQVLPKDIPRAELTAKMRGIAGALGVQCSFCHVENPETHRITDYAADDNRHKVAARRMMLMTAEINEKYLTRPGSTRPPDHPITCGNCHLGHEQPPAFVPPPPADRPGGPPAASQPPTAPESVRPM
jgi:hypothetical protein